MNQKNILMACIAVFAACMITGAVSALPEDIWSENITVTSGSLVINRTFGTNVSGSDGYDQNLDEVLPPGSPGDVLDAYFPLDDPDWSFFSRLGTDTRGSINSSNPECVWTLLVISKNDNALLTWNPATLPADIDFIMTANGSDYNMKSTSLVSLEKSTTEVTVAIRAEYSPNTLPVANFTVNATSGTAPLAVRFTDTSTGGPKTWYWSFGDGATSTLQNPVHTYTTAGTYAVNLTVTNANGSDVKCIPDYIAVEHGVVSIIVSGDGNASIGDEITLSGTNTDSELTYLVLAGPGLNASGVNPMNLSISATGNDPATFTTVAVKVNDTWEYRWETAAIAGGTLDEGVYTMYATSQPESLSDLAGVPNATVDVCFTAPVQPLEANFTANITTGTAPLTVQFTDTSCGYPTNWSWDFGDTITSTTQNPVHTYTTPGTYTVSLLVDGGVDTCTRTNFIKVIPVLFGDANDDKTVNQADTLRVLREVVGLATNPSPATDLFIRTDVHTNGMIDVGDAMFIAQYNVGLRDACFELV